jgi:hypothetical protein
MRRILPALLLLIIITACTGITQATPRSSDPVENASVETGTPIPADTATPTLVPEPTLTPTPEPPPAHWYWALENETNKLYAVDQDGKKREIGTLPSVEAENIPQGFQLDAERVLLFTTDDQLHAYLLTLDGMQPIELPADVSWGPDATLYRSVIAGRLDEHILFSYPTQAGVMKGFYPESGTMLLIDLQSLTAKRIDDAAYFDVSSYGFSDPRYWFHASADQRYVRYMNGPADRAEQDLREVDLLNGEVRTVYTTNSSPYYAYASPQGDLWHMKKSNAVLDVNGNQKDFDGESQTFFPLVDGKGIVASTDCAGTCELKVVTPFGSAPDLTFSLPWSIIDFYYPDMTQLMPDQDLIFAGVPVNSLSDIPSIVDQYPNWDFIDNPVFRLSPNGQSRLIGFYGSDTSDYGFPISPDGRYYFLTSPQSDSFFIYDAVEDRSLTEIPRSADLNYYFDTVRFSPTGIMISWRTQTEGIEKQFFHAYSHVSGTSFTWEDESREVYACVDQLEDTSLICWTYTDLDKPSSLLRYDPDTKEMIPLMENVISIMSLD